MSEKLLHITFKPTKKQISNVEKWLIEEREDTGEGFHCNWGVIEKSIEQNEFAILCEGKETVGFVVWTEWKLTGRIDIMEIKPSHRGKGLGKILTQELLKHFRSKDIVVVDLQCNPSDSEPIWRKLGFIDFPQRMTRDKYAPKELYQILVPYLKPVLSVKSKESLELWDKEPYEVRNSPPEWKWDLKFKKGTRELVTPIIHPSIRKWKVRWSLGDQVLKEVEVERFNSKNEIDFRVFIIIRKMPELP